MQKLQLFFLFMTVLCFSCATPIIGPKPMVPEKETLTLHMLEQNAYCAPVKIQRLGPDGKIEDVETMCYDASDHAPGLWIYQGRTQKGFVKSLVKVKEATPIPEQLFNAPLELHPTTLPHEITPSSNMMSSNAYFRFSVMSNGKPITKPVTYSASCLGRKGDFAAEHKKTMGSKGKVLIDQPGLWWITAEAADQPMLASLCFTISNKPDLDAYSAFLPDGTPLHDMNSIVGQLTDAEVIFVGEKHDDPVAHYLEAEILKAVHLAKGNTALSLEMFERDVQYVLNGYLKNSYSEKHFLASSRPWPSYKTDYKPMIEYAKKHQLPVIAANAPRRLVNFVTLNGPEKLKDLQPEELKWLPPLPYYIPTEGRYVEKLKQVFAMPKPKTGDKDALPGPRSKTQWKAEGCLDFEAYNKSLTAKKTKPSGGPMGKGGMPAHVMKMMNRKQGGYPSQSLWDASMAHAIASFLDDNPGVTVVQVNGSFHSDEHLGTVEQLLRYRPNTKVKVISINPDPSFPALNKEEFGKMGDVIIITDPRWRGE